jgi:hypothetical protein
MENAELEAKVHELEKALAVQQATMSGAEATQAASQAGMTSTMAATHGGTWATMVAGSVSLIVGIIVGIQIAKR